MGPLNKARGIEPVAEIEDTKELVVLYHHTLALVVPVDIKVDAPAGDPAAGIEAQFDAAFQVTGKIEFGAVFPYALAFCGKVGIAQTERREQVRRYKKMFPNDPGIIIAQPGPEMEILLAAGIIEQLQAVAGIVVKQRGHQAAGAAFLPLRLVDQVFKREVAVQDIRSGARPLGYFKIRYLDIGVCTLDPAGRKVAGVLYIITLCAVVGNGLQELAREKLEFIIPERRAAFKLFVVIGPQKPGREAITETDKLVVEREKGPVFRIGAQVYILAGLIDDGIAIGLGTQVTFDQDFFEIGNKVAAIRRGLLRPCLRSRKHEHYPGKQLESVHGPWFYGTLFCPCRLPALCILGL